MTGHQSFSMVDGIKCYSLDKAQEYEDYPEEGFDLTVKLEEDSFWCKSRIRLLKRIIRRYSSQTQRLRFLEIGSGNGSIVREFAYDRHLVVTGSEIYLKGLRYIRQRIPAVELVQFDVQTVILDERFEIIGAFDVLEHIEDDRAALSNIYSMLRAGGYFIATVPQYMFLWSDLDAIVKHKRRYSKAELIDKLRKEKFDIAFVSSFLFVLFPLMIVSRFLDKRKRKIEPSKNAFERRVRFSKTLNWILDKFMRIDEFLIEKGASLPFGGSLLAIARKRV